MRFIYFLVLFCTGFSIMSQSVSDSLTRMHFFNRIESFSEAAAVLSRTRPLIDEDTAFFFHFTAAQTAGGLLQFDSAVVRYKKAFAIDSTRQNVNRALAIALAQNNDLPAAVTAFKRILSEDDLATKERMWLAKLYVKQDMPDSALFTIQSRPKLLYYHYSMQHMEARLLYRMNLYGPALSIYKTLIKRKPSDDALFMEYLKTLAKTSPQTVIDSADWLFDRYPSHEVAYIIAKGQQTYHNFEQALRWFNIAIEASIPTSIDVYYSFAAYLSEQLERTEEALLFYEKALSYNPSDGFHAYHIALIYDNIGNHARAKSYFQQFLKSPQAKENNTYSTFANERLLMYKQSEFMQRAKE